MVPAASNEDDVVEVSSEDEDSSENDVVEVSSDDDVVEVEESEVEVVAKKVAAASISGKPTKQ